jgi:hypothetical protein
VNLVDWSNSCHEHQWTLLHVTKILRSTVLWALQGHMSAIRTTNAIWKILSFVESPCHFFPYFPRVFRYVCRLRFLSKLLHTLLVQFQQQSWNLLKSCDRLLNQYH